MTTRPGFTFFEVLAALVVLTIGVFSAITLVVYGLRLSALANGRATGMATAVSVAADAAPLLGPDHTWTGGANASGRLNGFWVTRVEDDRQAAGPELVSAAVHVDVYESLGGRLVASFDTRILRRAPP